MPKISEAGREILKKWQDMGVKFEQVAMPINTYLDFKRDAENYSIPEQPVPEGVTLNDRCVTQTQGLLFKRDDTASFLASIPAQPIPKELLEMEELKKDILIHHIPERKLWLAQREAGTNEVWQKMFRNSGVWIDINVEYDPTWSSDYEYRVKPKTVKYYFCAVKHKNGSIGLLGQYGPKEAFELSLAFGGATIIWNIEECDVEV